MPSQYAFNRVLATSLILSFTAAWFCSVSGAEQGALTPREQELLQRVEQLENRLAELEAKVNSPASDAASASAETTAPAAAPAPAKDAVILTPSWRNGLRFQSEDGQFSMKVGGRLHLDYAYIDEPRSITRVFGKASNTGEFRRARLDINGQMYGNVGYRMEYDFADDGVGKFKDVYLQVLGIPYVGTITAGHFREPMGLERLTNLNFDMFMERSLVSAMVPGRNLGIMVDNGAFEDRLTWAVGGFKEVDDFPSRDDAESGYAVTARVTGRPWYAEKGRRMLHLGLSYSHRNPDGDVLGYSTRPEANLAGRYLNTERYEGFRLVDARMDQERIAAGEAALVFGPFSLQGEYVRNMIETDWAGKVDFTSFYAEASYFLTGENRNFRQAGAIFDRVAPRRNFALTGERGWGAWEVAVRYSGLDLDDGLIRGGEERNWTLGLNWHLNPNTRWSWNYILADIDHDLYSGQVDILQTRFQLDF